MGHVEVIQTLRGWRFSLNDEKKLQSQIEERFKAGEIKFSREHAYSEDSIVDFLTEDGCAVEVKIKGGRMDIFRQLERYCSYDATKELVFVTNTPVGIPSEINGKPVYVFDLGIAWL